MSADEKVAKELVETLKDGRKGFASAAEKLQDGERSDAAAVFQRLSEQRAGFARDIVALGHDYGDDVDESGTATAALHRGWIALKDALTGDDASGVLGAAATGEDHAVSEYEKALEEDDLSDGFRAVVQQQHADVVAARDEVKALQHSA
ncbi:PA2169 family four-helix-bundle protein [Phycicoccus sp. HDW14]|uniref:ferritin-like domain-containing protein n=1 Tax=Phycicoccus sp. HDW14 TaxID=2714941 RepID=UPI00140A7C2E|nr:PA2169 family four-helix-bundle protein [Phycicoccus sp. HDW14]QIM22119.1 PA2169 family four-helix-bundle protein [Phycicoccus sp. HDW14]